MIDAIVWGFCGTEGHAIVKRLKEEHVLNPVLWISDSPQSMDIFSFLLCTEAVLTARPDGIDEDTYRTTFRDHINTFIRMRIRQGYLYSDYHELISEFNILYSFFFNAIKRSSIELVLFANLPHEGADYVLYLVCQELSVPTLMTSQSIFPARFFMFRTMEDYGRVCPFPRTNHPEPVAVSEGFKQECFYMRGVQPPGEGWSPYTEALFKTLYRSYVFRKSVVQGGWRFVTDLLTGRLQQELRREIKFLGTVKRMKLDFQA